MCGVCMCGVCMCGVCMCGVCMCGVCMCGVCMCGVYMCGVYMCGVYMCGMYMCGVCASASICVCICNGYVDPSNVCIIIIVFILYFLSTRILTVEFVWSICKLHVLLSFQINQIICLG